MRLTVAQALVRFLANQWTSRDGVERRLFAGCFGIFGHGNVAGIGEALLEAGDDLRYYQARNEQAMVHAAVGYARMNNRLSTLACTTSIGPGATNMVTGAALATVNRIPVLLLPGDVFATRVANPVLQELEDPRSYDVSVNDCFKPVSRYFDRINRPEQLPSALLAAMRVLTDPAETGAGSPGTGARRRCAPRSPAPPDRGRRRCHLLGGDRRAAVLCGGDRDSSCGDP